MTVWRMRIACWITQPTNTNSQYVILTAFSLQKQLQERAYMFRYTQVACLVFFNFELADGRVCSLHEHKQNIAAVNCTGIYA
jgi:hypothetical protein